MKLPRPVPLYLIAIILWLMSAFSLQLFEASPLGKDLWSYNNDAKGAGGNYKEMTWACPARNGGYWPCTPQEGIQNALSQATTLIVGSPFILILVIASLFYGSLGLNALIVSLFFFPPAGIFFTYVILSGIAKIIKNLKTRISQ